MLSFYIKWIFEIKHFSYAYVARYFCYPVFYFKQKPHKKFVIHLYLAIISLCIAYCLSSLFSYTVFFSNHIIFFLVWTARKPLQSFHNIYFLYISQYVD